MTTSRRALPIILSAALAFGFAACGGDDDAEEALDKARTTSEQLQQDAEELRKDAEEATKSIQEGADPQEAADELQKQGEELTNKTKTAAGEILDSVEDTDNLPPEAREALEEAQQQLQQP